MIVVGSFNTAVDKCLDLERLVPGEVLTAGAADSWPGGKGIHVALAAAALGEPVTLVGIVDAANRPPFDAFLAEWGVTRHWVDVGAPLRTNLVLREASGVLTEIREPGEPLAPEEAEALVGGFVGVAGRARVVVLAGSLPGGLPPETYRELASCLAERNVTVLVDAGGETLRRALEARPYAVKPNREEAAALTGGPVDGIEGATAVVRALADAGVALPLCSLGAEGLLAGWQGRLLHVTAPVRPVRNSVGAGDCLLGGLAVGLRRGLPVEESLRLAVACGTAKVMSPEIGLLRPEDVEDVLPEVQVRERS